MGLKKPQERLHEDALKAWTLKAGIIVFIEGLLYVGIWVLSYFIGPFPLGIMIGAGVLIIVLAAVQVLIIPRIKMAYWGYQIDESAIDIQYGIIVVKRILIPMSRVQHVDTERGPIMRLLDLATLSVSTAGSNHKIPALKHEQAERLRQRISELASLSDDDV